MHHSYFSFLLTLWHMTLMTLQYFTFLVFHNVTYNFDDFVVFDVSEHFYLFQKYWLHQTQSWCTNGVDHKQSSLPQTTESVTSLSRFIQPIFGLVRHLRYTFLSRYRVHLRIQLSWLFPIQLHWLNSIWSLFCFLEETPFYDLLIQDFPTAIQFQIIIRNHLLN